MLQCSLCVMFFYSLRHHHPPTYNPHPPTLRCGLRIRCRCRHCPLLLVVVVGVISVACVCVSICGLACIIYSCTHDTRTPNNNHNQQSTTNNTMHVARDQKNGTYSLNAPSVADAFRRSRSAMVSVTAMTAAMSGIAVSVACGGPVLGAWGMHCMWFFF